MLAKTMKYITTTTILLVAFILLTTVGHAGDEAKLIVKYKGDKKVVILNVASHELEKRVFRLEKNPNVQYVEYDAPIYLAETSVNDPNYIEQEQLFNMMYIPGAWQHYNPQDEIVIAIIDTGVDLDHPDLASQLVEGYNFIEEGNPPEDTHGHGSHVAGLVGALTNNEVGIASAALNVKMMPIKVLDGNSGNISNLIKGIEFAVEKNVDIINLSLGSYVNMKSLRDAIKLAYENDILVVCAVGNDNDSDIMYPAYYKEVLAVASTNETNSEKANFSNYGITVDVVAPGVGIYSTWLDGYNYQNGTSMSTAIVTSIAAMIRQQEPWLSNDQIKQMIEETAVPIVSQYSLGNGAVHAEKALLHVYNKNRIYGKSAIDTAVEISKTGWSQLKEKTIVIDGQEVTGKFVIVASGNTFPDSLAAAPLTTYLDSPLLLQRKATINPVNVAELERLQATNVIIIGGEGAITETVAEDLRNLELTVHRVSGSSRYETAVKLNELIPYQSKKAIIVSGENFPDALSVSSYAAQLNIPILYVSKNKIKNEVLQYIQDYQITETYVIGGTGVISEEVIESLPSPTRIFGSNRYETSFEVIKYFGVVNAREVYFATGENFPDALAGSALGGKNNNPVFLVKPETNSSILNQFLQYARDNNVTNYRIFGGNSAITIKKAWNIDKMLQSPE
ncbi:hypothetical protein CIB95_12100 [Lottiidibacillus patelloidae]|uniref:Peptidase S8/S53 domain-containing protein n=1 Tax=Lottiidibacillus patelloidae TaxID=2670334 RepID=A0A263BSG2_9BACI|nr:S8 family serine peptidase [Lottiidibacillus patelloidae]OZM56508.1 hypothetical protein CIB95_12100 [Lottiidibacillus patelloidae]